MRKIALLGMALAVFGVVMTALDPPEALATHVVIHRGVLHETVTTVSAGDHVTWINATGDPAVSVVFEDRTPGVPVRSRLFYDGNKHRVSQSRYLPVPYSCRG